MDNRGKNSILKRFLSLVNRAGQRNLAKESLRESEEKYRTLFESSVDGVFLMTDVFLDCNEQACKMWGCAREEIIGHPPAEFSPPLQLDGSSSTEKAREHIEAALAGTPQFFYWKHRRKNGTLMDADVSLKALNVGGKRILQAVVRDITRQKQVEAEKAELQEQLRQSQKMEAIGCLAGGVAHDFRNQLVVIQGFAEMLQRRLLVGEEGRNEITEILNAIERSTQLTSQLLRFSRKERLEPQVVDLSAFVGDMPKSLLHMIGEDIRLSVNHGTRSCRANVDPNLLQNAIMNLIVNARDAMPNGGDLIITTDVVDMDSGVAQGHLDAKPGQYATIFVEDTGIGMDEATRERIFEPFFTTREVGEGTGLGLSMVYGFVKQSGGFIKCESELEKGTRFSIYLPNVDQATTKTETVVESQTQEFQQGSETILVAEDEEPVRRMLVESLRESGYSVLEAESSKEALLWGERLGNQIDMLLTDVIMPGMNGVELADRIKAAKPGIAILFVSGYTRNELSRRGADSAGSNYLLTKPFSHEMLLRRVRQVFASTKGMPRQDTD